MGKGFTLSHQKVVLDVDLNGHASGYTELTIQPTDANLKTLFLNSRECYIKAVKLSSSGNALAFHLGTPIQTAVTTPIASNNIRSTYPEFKRRLFQATNEAEEGELAISIPAGTVRRTNTSNTTRDGSLAPQANGVDGAASPDPTAKAAGKEPEYDSIQILIEYDIRDPRDGIHVVKPSELYPHRTPHCYTSAATADSARCWVPCVDALWERCTWELIFSIASVISFEQDTERGIEVEEFPLYVIASGELVEQVTHPHNPNKTIFYYSQATPTTVQHIAFAYGPFSILDISPLAQKAREAELLAAEDPDPEAVGEAEVAEAEGQLQMHAFCLPGREEELQNTVSFMTRSLGFYLEELGSYPFSSFKMIFLDDAPFTLFNSAALAMFSTELLYPSSAIDQAYETRQALTYSLAAQWIGINIIQKTWADTWLIQGLSLWVNALCMRKLMGNNEYRFRLKKDVTRCCAWDERMAPLCQPGILQPPSQEVMPFINLKSPLVMHILDRQLLKAGTHNGLSRVIPKLFLSAISGDLKENLLSTHNFLRMCRKVSGTDLRGFAEQWIYAAGCPRFHITANFNRKRMAVELAIKQESPAAKYAEQADWAEKVNLRPVSTFEGQMTVRIHEADGTPYEHVIDIREMYKKHEVGFNTKYKRIRRSTKRFQARKAAEEAAANGDVEAMEAIGHTDTSFALPLWDDAVNPATPRNREAWKVADWSEEDEKAQEQAVYEWIRIDTEFEWIATFSFEQPDFMWISQLQRDRDVVAQLEAVHALARLKTSIVSSILAKTVLVPNYFYRIRTEAALALVSTCTKSLDYIGLFYLFKIFQTRYCFDPEKESLDAFHFRCVPRPNDFSDFSEYHLRKSIIIAISHVRDERGYPFPQVQQFLVNLLKYNDNEQNNFSDAYYITAIIAALGNPFVSGSSREQGDLVGVQYMDEMPEEAVLTAAVDEVNRYANLDRLVPSYHNIITVAAIEWRVKMMMASLIPLDIKSLLSYSREGNYAAVRTAAFEGLLLLRALQEKILARYILAVLLYDSSRVVARRLAQAIVDNLPILAAMDEMHSAESGYFEEENHRVPSKQQNQSVESILKVLRNSVGRSIMLRDSLTAVLFAPNVDIETRWAMLKICEVLVKPSEEALPKIKLRMPANILRLSSMTNAGSPDGPLSGSIGASGPLKVKVNGAREPSVDATGKPPLKLVIGSKTGQPKLLKEQKSGMNLQDLKVCQNLMQKLTNTKKADLFRHPVDPVRDGAPTYFEHIKAPMDLSTMANKLDAGLYKDRNGFRDDFKLMIGNCYLFNGRESAFGNLANIFDAHFDKQWERANTTLEQLRKKSQNETTFAVLPPRSARAPSQQLGNASALVADDSIFARPSVPPPTPLATSAAPASSRPLLLKLSFGASSSGQPPSSQPLATPVTPAAPAASVSDVPAVPTPAIPEPRLSVPPLDTIIKPEPPTPSLPPIQTTRLESPFNANGASQQPAADGISRSSSPGVPLAVTSSATVARPKISFRSSLSARPKAEPTEENFTFATPAPPRPSESPRNSVEPSAKPTKIRLSINGSSSLGSAHPASAVQAATPLSAMTPSGANRHGYRASSNSSTGDAATLPVNVKKMQAFLTKLLRMDESFFFRRPVDPVLDGCQTYYDEIKHPMDLGTMQQKLNEGRYYYQQEMNEDFEQIVTNCKIFNPPGTLPVAHAEALQVIWRAEMVKVGKLAYNEKRALQGMLNRLRLRPSAFIFLEAVDPIAEGIPNYFNVINREDARDMSLLKRKLENDEYNSFEAFEADFRLMISNCLTFNGDDSPAGELGKDLEGEFDREFAGIKAQFSGGFPANKQLKRGSMSGSGGGMVKKIRLSTG